MTSLVELIITALADSEHDQPWLISWRRPVKRRLTHSNTASPRCRARRHPPLWLSPTSCGELCATVGGQTKLHWSEFIPAANQAPKANEELLPSRAELLCLPAPEVIARHHMSSPVTGGSSLFGLQGKKRQPVSSQPDCWAGNRTHKLNKLM